MPNGKGSVTPVRMEHHRRGNYPKQEKVAWKSEATVTSKANPSH
jgi:hypothetical protein